MREARTIISNRTTFRSGIVKISNAQQLEDKAKAAKSTATDARMFMPIMNSMGCVGALGEKRSTNIQKHVDCMHRIVKHIAF